MGESPMVSFEFVDCCACLCCGRIGAVNGGSGGTINLSPPSNDVSSKPLALVLGLGGSILGCCCLCSLIWLLMFCSRFLCPSSFCCLNFCASSDVKSTVEVLPPKNFSQPGAPVLKQNK